MTKQEAIDVLNANYPDAYYELLRGAVDLAIEALSAQPKRETGTYTERREDDGYCRYATCNECGESWMGSRNYCPNCGRSMNEKEKENAK